MTTKTLTGPSGIRIELDSAQIFPDDPGQGTPAMVYVDSAKARGMSATYWCAADTGELDGMPVLSSKQVDWLHAQDEAVAAFIEGGAK
jgi:hypothetical protein